MAKPLIHLAIILLFAQLSIGAQTSTVSLSFSSPFPVSSPSFGSSSDSPPQVGFLHSDLEELLLNFPDEQKAREWNLHYTSEPHFLGQGEPHAVWTRDKWREFGVENTSIVSYPVPVPLTIPSYQRLALLKREAGDTEGQQHDAELFSASLRENNTFVNPISGKIISTPQFASSTPSGNVTAPFVFLNLGEDSDYKDLERLNIDVAGKIGIVKQGQLTAWSALLKAQERGIVGLVMYIDPGFDENVTEAHGYQSFPDGPARAPMSVVRRSGIDHTQITNSSKPSLKIPGIPISYAEALPFLKALNGHGPQASDVGSAWQGGQLGYLGVNYNVGPSPASLTINLVNNLSSSNVSAYDVIGTIKGTIEDEVIILGNHRDAWAAGAGDPNSGSAALNEVIRTLGAAMEKGWKPFRTLVFASWDGHEAGVWGSSLWVENNLPWLSKAAVAYIEVETAATGTRLYTKTSPLLSNIIHGAAAKVPSPDQSTPGQSVLDVWGGQLDVEGGGDTTYFVNNGIASLNFGFAPGPLDAVFHWHSDYDNIEWMDNFGDPTYEYHTASAKLWALAATHLVEEPVLPFNVTAYAVSLDGYLDELNDTVRTKSAEDGGSALSSCSFSLQPLEDAIAQLHQVAIQFDTEAADLGARLVRRDADSRASDYLQDQKLQDINRKYRTFERQFVHLPERPGADSRHYIYSKWAKVITEKVHNAAELLKS
ncbi:hypothetical protein BBP40_009995 [Aspergillus hancockii]|nr:hypothetical protein BBP40_009995 [Aspergillus hancockii]